MRSNFMLIFSILFIGLAASAESKTFIGGGFGIDGNNPKSIPRAISQKQALNIFNSLNIRKNRNGVKRIRASQGEFECRINSCSFVFSDEVARLSFEADRKMNVYFSGKVAQKLFEILPADSTAAKIGVGTRSVENLTCTRIIIPGALVNCSLRDVFAQKKTF